MDFYPCFFFFLFIMVTIYFARYYNQKISMKRMKQSYEEGDGKGRFVLYEFIQQHSLINLA